MKQSKHFIAAIEDGRMIEVLAPPECNWRNALEQLSYQLITEGVAGQQVTINVLEEI